MTVSSEPLACRKANPAAVLAAITDAQAARSQWFGWSAAMNRQASDSAHRPTKPTRVVRRP